MNFFELNVGMSKCVEIQRAGDEDVENKEGNIVFHVARLQFLPRSQVVDISEVENAHFSQDIKNTLPHI